MDTLLKGLTLLPWIDWLALALFFSAWVAYTHFSRRLAQLQPSILFTTNQWRRRWMLQATYREHRIVDSAVTQSLAASPTFFASTSILIIGGLLASLGATEKASELVRELPFAARTSVLVFDLKLTLLAAIFVHAFFASPGACASTALAPSWSAPRPRPFSSRTTPSARLLPTAQAG